MREKSELYNFVTKLLFMFLTTLICWIAWGGVGKALFPMLPVAWLEIGYWQTFGLLWIICLLGSILRNRVGYCDKCGSTYT